MGVSKVVLNGNVLVDLTGVTVEATNLVSPNTAIGADGEDVTGSLQAKTSSDLTVSGATVTAPAGVYSTDASASVASGSATTPATTITANPSISVSSGGLITASNSKTQSVTPTVSAGYVSSGTAGTITVSGSNTSQLTTQAAQTIYPSTSDQTITSGKYLTGTQTFKGVLLTNLTAGNIKKDVVVKVGDSADDDRITSVTGTYEGSGGGGGTVLKLYSNFANYTNLYIDSARTTTIAEYYNYDYNAVYAALNAADSIVIVGTGASSGKLAWALLIDYDPIDETFEVHYLAANPGPVGAQAWRYANLYA